MLGIPAQATRERSPADPGRSAWSLRPPTAREPTVGVGAVEAGPGGPPEQVPPTGLREPGAPREAGSREDPVAHGARGRGGCPGTGAAPMTSGHCRARLACPVPSTPAGARPGVCSGPRPGVCSGPRPSWGAAHTPPPLTAHAAPPWHAIALHTPVLQTCRAAHCSDAGARACGAHAQAASHTRTRVHTPSRARARRADAATWHTHAHV